MCVSPFTTMRVERGRIWFLPEHRQRLIEGAEALALEAPPLDDLGTRVLRAAEGMASARVRVTLARGGEIRIEAEPYRSPRTPLRVRPVVVAPDRERVRRKTTDRAMYRDARARVVGAGWDDALLISSDGEVLESTVANVFLLVGGRLVTPPADRPLLAGIARGRILKLASHAGWPAEEAPIRANDVRGAAACLLSNALLPLHPVGEVAGMAVFQEPEGLVRDLCEVLLVPSSEVV